MHTRSPAAAQSRERGCVRSSEWLGRALHLGDRQNVEDDRIRDKEERYQASGIKQYLIWLVKREQLEG